MSEFRTKDIAIAATLLHERCPLLGLDRSSGRDAYFLFENSDSLQQVVSQYWRGDLLCPAQSLLASFKQAKHILYDGHI
ncbi:hypothetical protein HYS30_01205 [Candidatus Peregrinibacteria bacterium]|nr:hypothetical protein [Candidatus Peregrinibacteria bacterium]